jgi:hypothetical protein
LKEPACGLCNVFTEIKMFGETSLKMTVFENAEVHP